MSVTEVARREHGWLAFIDVYGFKHFVLSTRLDLVGQAMEHIHYWIEREASGSLHVFMFSDAICIFSPVAGSEPTFQSLDRLNSFIMKLQQAALSEKIVFRGSIEFGELYLGSKICIGQPLINAYGVEQILEVPLICLPVRVMHKENLNDRLEVRRWRAYTLPCKANGELLAYVLFPHPIDILRTHVAEMLKTSVIEGPEHVTKTWHTLQNILETVVEREHGSRYSSEAG